MRRLIISAAGVLALIAAVTVGPLGTAAAAPYVYGCTPATWPDPMLITSYNRVVSIYNGSASSAAVTMKVLSGNGTILVLQSQVLDATHSRNSNFSTPPGYFTETDGVVAASVRIVASVPISATITHIHPSGDYRPIVCTSQQP